MFKCLNINIWDKIRSKTATLADQEEACKSPESAYEFVLLKIPGADFEKLQEAACKTSFYAHYFALNIPGANIKYCQEHACKDPSYAVDFAETIIGANIEYCQEHACKDPINAFDFADLVPGADIEYCRKACESDLKWLKAFDKMIAKKVLA